MSPTSTDRPVPNPVTQSNPDHKKSTTNPTGRLASDAANASSADSRDPTQNLGPFTAPRTNLPAPILSSLPVFCGSDGKSYIEINDGKNAYALRIGGKQANRFLRRLAHRSGTRLKANDLRDFNDDLIAHAELSGDTRDVWYRTAPYQNGTELDVGDERHTRIRVTPGKMDIIENGSETLFHRTSGMRPFVMPGEHGNFQLLKKYSNLDAASFVLLTAWITYTIAHPKVSTTNYIILVLQGDQGSGKSTLCQIIQALVDPNAVGVQTFPRNQKDLVIAAQNAHTLLYDNMRDINPAMADTLSIAATGGTLTTRQLYTDADQQVHKLHVALVLNGIHSFIDQPDLAQRCLPLYLRPIDEKNRLSEAEFIREFQTDLPIIFRGLLDLIANIFTYLPSVEVTNPERMIDFVHWLAAMEKVDEAPTGVYQMQYSDALNETMLDSLQENSLAAAILSFADKITNGQWSGTPTDLMAELNLFSGKRAKYSREWPQNSIALSKRLRSLQAGLRRQGIDVELGRGKERRITIVRMEDF